MAIVRWGPARDLLTMRDLMDRMMDETWRTAWGGRQGAWGESVVEMPLDVYQTDKE